MELIAKTLTVVFVFTNVLFAYQPETSFWDQRQLASLSTPTTLHPVPMPEMVMPSFKPRFDSLMKEKTHKVLPKTFHSYVNVRHVYETSSPKTVILLEDVHMNQEAQKNLSYTIKSFGSLTSDKPIVVGLEGAYGPFLYDRYKKFNEEVGLLVADSFFQSGEISGPAHAGFTSHKNPGLLFWGVDDRNLYEQNVSAYKSTKQNQRTQLKALQEKHQIIQQQKKTIYNADLIEFDQKARAFSYDDLFLGDYLKILSSYGLDISINAETFLQAYQIEKEINFSQVQYQQEKILQKLVKNLNDKELQKLLQLSWGYNQGQVSFAEYFNALKTISKDNHVDLSKTPAFERYIQYALLSDGIKIDSLIQEVAALESRVYVQLAMTSKEKDLIQQDKANQHSQKLVQFEMTPHQWEQYQQFKITGLESYELFYMAAEARNEAMVRNLLERMKVSDLGILVAGGFHSKGIIELLEKAGVSFVVATPKITKLDLNDKTHYLSVFDREKTSLEKMFSGKKLFVSKPREGAQKPFLGGTSNPALWISVSSLAQAVGNVGRSAVIQLGTIGGRAITTFVNTPASLFTRLTTSIVETHQFATDTVQIRSRFSMGGFRKNGMFVLAPVFPLVKVSLTDTDAFIALVALVALIVLVVGALIGNAIVKGIKSHDERVAFQKDSHANLTQKKEPSGLNEDVKRKLGVHVEEFFSPERLQSLEAELRELSPDDVKVDGVYKTYDVRSGDPHNEMTGAQGAAKAVAFLNLALQKAEDDFGPELASQQPVVVVGRDARKSSREYQEAGMAGLYAAGAEIIDLGSQDPNHIAEFYFALSYTFAISGFKRPVVGLFYTASHVQGDVAGIKGGFGSQNGVINLSSEQVAVDWPDATKSIVAANSFRYGSFIPVTQNGLYKQFSVRDNYFKSLQILGGQSEHYLEKDHESYLALYAQEIAETDMTHLGVHDALSHRQITDDKPLEGLKLLVDTGHAAAGLTAPQLYSVLGADVVESRTDVHAIGAKHVADPNDAALRKPAIDKLDDSFDAAILYDLDGDRGQINIVIPGQAPIELTGDKVGALFLLVLAEAFKNSPKKLVVGFDVKSSYALKLLAQELGFVIVEAKTGYPNVLKAIEDKVAEDPENLQAGVFIEKSGHMGSLLTQMKEDPTVNASLIFKMAAENKRAGERGLLDLLEQIPDYLSTDEVKASVHPRLIQKHQPDFDPSTGAKPDPVAFNKATNDAVDEIDRLFLKENGLPKLMTVDVVVAEGAPLNKVHITSKLINDLDRRKIGFYTQTGNLIGWANFRFSSNDFGWSVVVDGPRENNPLIEPLIAKIYQIMRDEKLAVFDAPEYGGRHEVVKRLGEDGLASRPNRGGHANIEVVLGMIAIGLQIAIGAVLFKLSPVYFATVFGIFLVGSTIAFIGWIKYRQSWKIAKQFGRSAMKALKTNQGYWPAGYQSEDIEKLINLEDEQLVKAIMLKENAFLWAGALQALREQNEQRVDEIVSRINEHKNTPGILLAVERYQLELLFSESDLIDLELNRRGVPQTQRSGFVSFEMMVFLAVISLLSVGFFFSGPLATTLGAVYLPVMMAKYRSRKKDELSTIKELGRELLVNLLERYDGNNIQVGNGFNDPIFVERDYINGIITGGQPRRVQRLNQPKNALLWLTALRLYADDIDDEINELADPDINLYEDVEDQVKLLKEKLDKIEIEIKRVVTSLEPHQIRQILDPPLGFALKEVVIVLAVITSMLGLTLGVFSKPIVWVGTLFLGVLGFAAQSGKSELEKLKRKIKSTERMVGSIIRQIDDTKSSYDRRSIAKINKLNKKKEAQLVKLRGYRKQLATLKKNEDESGSASGNLKLTGVIPAFIIAVAPYHPAAYVAALAAFSATMLVHSKSLLRRKALHPQSPAQIAGLHKQLKAANGLTARQHVALAFLKKYGPSAQALGIAHISSQTLEKSFENRIDEIYTTQKTEDIQINSLTYLLSAVDVIKFNPTQVFDDLSQAIESADNGAAYQSYVVHIGERGDEYLGEDYSDLLKTQAQIGALQLIHPSLNANLVVAIHPQSAESEDVKTLVDGNGIPTAVMNVRPQFKSDGSELISYNRLLEAALRNNGNLDAIDAVLNDGYGSERLITISKRPGLYTAEGRLLDENLWLILTTLAGKWVALQSIGDIIRTSTKALIAA